MSSVYPTVTRFPTSGAKSTMTVSFAHEDAEESLLNFDYVQLDFNPKNFLMGLVDVVFEKTEAENAYKIIEKIGGYDRTEEFGSLIADGAAEVMNNTTSASYADGVITIVPKAGAVPSVEIPDTKGNVAATFTVTMKDGQAQVETDSTKPYTVVVHQ